MTGIQSLRLKFFVKREGRETVVLSADNVDNADFFGEYGSRRPPCQLCPQDSQS